MSGKKKLFGIFFAAFALCVFLGGQRTLAKNADWRTKNQRTYYYSQKKKLKGLHKIGKKYYYFDKRGIQRTGWQKIKGEYYFFYIKNGKKGFMATSQKINGVSLGKKGKAKKTKQSLARLNVLIKANRIVESIAKPGMSKYDKLKRCFQYCLKNFIYRGSPAFYGQGDWELRYALDMFDEGHGNCYAFGAAFAFLANAAGYDSAYAVSSGGHGWAEVRGRIFDLSWELIDKRHSYFDVPSSLSGVGGRPNYRGGRAYVRKI